MFGSNVTRESFVMLITLVRYLYMARS